MVRGTIYIAISQIVFVFTNFALHPYLGRKLGPELYGVFGVINTFIVIVELIMMKGIYETISKFVSEKEEVTKVIISRTLKVMTIASLVIGGICFLLAEQIASLMNDLEIASYIKLLAFIIPILGISTVFLGAMNGLRQFGKQALISITFYIVRMICIIIPVFSGYSVKGAVIGMIVAEIFRLVLAKVLFRPIDTGGIDLESKKMFGFAMQLIIIGILTAFVMNMDLLAVKVIMKDNLQTGLYTAAVTIAKIPLLLMYPVSITVLPTISKSTSDGNKILTEIYIKQSLRLLLIFVLPISLMILATSENCISLFYGNRYIPGSAPLNILLLGAIFLSIKVVMYNVIVASGWPRYVVLIGLLSLFIDVALLIALINSIGLVGAAMSTTIIHFLGFLLSYGYVAKKFMIHIIPPFLIRIGLSSLIIYLIATVYSPTGITLLFYYGILFCLFFFILVMMKEINLIEIKLKLIRTWETFSLKNIS